MKYLFTVLVVHLLHSDFGWIIISRMVEQRWKRAEERQRSIPIIQTDSITLFSYLLKTSIIQCVYIILYDIILYYIILMLCYIILYYNLHTVYYIYVCVPYIDGTYMAIPKQIEQQNVAMLGPWGPPSHKRFSSLLQATRLGLWVTSRKFGAYHIPSGNLT